MGTDHSSCQLIPWSDLREADLRELTSLASHQEYSGPFMGHDWFGPYVTAFAPPRPHLLASRRGERIAAAIPVHFERQSWAGRSALALSSMTNRWTPRFEPLLDPAAADLLPELLRNAPRLSGGLVIILDRLPCEAPAVRALADSLKRLGVPHHFDVRNPSPFKALPTSGDELLSGLNGKFRANLRNRERRLKRCGEVRFSVTGAGESLLPALEQFFALEQRGWKGTAGGAIAEHEDALRFYKIYGARSAAGFTLAFLWLDERIIAAQMLLQSGSTMFLLKTAYDEEYRTYSPGQLITWQAMELAIRDGLSRFDFLGLATDWKLDWGCQLHENTCLYVFADSLAGRFALWTRFGWRRQLKRIGPLRALVRRVREGKQP